MNTFSISKQIIENPYFPDRENWSSTKIRLLILSIHKQWLGITLCVPLQLQTIPELAHPVSVTTAWSTLYLCSSPLYLGEIPATISVINNSVLFCRTHPKHALKMQIVNTFPTILSFWAWPKSCVAQYHLYTSIHTIRCFNRLNSNLLSNWNRSLLLHNLNY